MSFDPPGTAPKAAPPLPKAPFTSPLVVWSPAAQLVAAAALPAGTVVVREVPASTFDFSYDAAGTPLVQEVGRVSRLLVQGLPTSQRALYPPGDAAAVARLAAQCLVFGGEDGSTAMVCAVCPVLSRVGHSDTPTCTLSVHWAFRITDRVVLSLLTVRDVGAGEELTLAPVSRVMDPAARAERWAWQFREGGGGRGGDLPPPPHPSLVGTVGEGGAHVAALNQLYTAVPRSASITPANASAGHAAARAFLDTASGVLADTHWMVVSARRTAIVGLMYSKAWGPAWALLRTQGRAVFSLLSPAEAEAQYHTHALAEHLLRGWQVEDPPAAAAASLGAMLRYTAAVQAGKPAPAEGREGDEEEGEAPPPPPPRVDHEDAWVRDMLWGAGLLRSAQQQGFVEGLAKA